MMPIKHISLAVACVAIATAFWLGTGETESVKTGVSEQDLKQLVERLSDAESEIAHLRQVIQNTQLNHSQSAPSNYVVARSQSPSNGANTEGGGSLSSPNRKRSVHTLPDFASSSEAVAWAQDNIVNAERPPRRLQALQLLMEHDPSTAVDAIHTLIAQGDSEVGDVIAGFGIIEMGASSDIMQTEDLKHFYQSKNPQLRRVSAKILLDRGDPSLATDYIQNRASMLQESSVQDKSIALDEIGSMGNKIAVPYILPMLNDANTYVKTRALNALIHTGSADNIADISPLLNDDVAIVREKAAETIDALRHGGMPPITHPQGAEIRAGMMTNRVPME